jgi:acyl-coenzyme A thioesterase 13
MLLVHIYNKLYFYIYLAPANRGDTVIVDAKVIKSGRSIAFTTADFYRKRDNVMIATGRQTKAFPSSK